MLLVLAVTTLAAAPVRNMPAVRVQPNGDTLRLFVSGDEFFHRLHDAADYTIVQDVETGVYVYATLADDGTLAPTSLLPGKDNPAKAGLRPGLKPAPKVLREMRRQWEIPEEYREPEGKRQSWAFTRMNNIVIFVRFNDETALGNEPFSTYSAMFNDSTGSSVSMYSYFRRASYGNLTLPTYFYPAPSGSTVLSYQDSLPRNYYRPYNATTNPNGYNTDTERRNREFGLLQRAVNWVNANCPVDPSIVLDYDNDGKIDNITFVVSGTYTGWSDLLWPHKWSLYDRNVYINGKRVYTFNLQLAGSGSHYFSVGTFCHEMTHTLGAPDLYHYDEYDDVSPAGAWDLMCSNGANPQSTNSLFRLKYMGWLDSIPQLTDSGRYTMQSLMAGPNNAYKIASSDPHQWYILEYRNNTDTGDQCIPGSGMLIWRYKDNAPSNADFDYFTNQHELWLFRPNSSSDTINGNVAQAAFGVSGRTNFTSVSNPHPYLCNGNPDTTFSILDIQVAANNQSVSFTFIPQGGAACTGNEPLPVAMGFEDGSVGCWTEVQATSSNSSRVGVYDYAGCGVIPHSGNYLYRFSSYSTSTNYTQYLISPRLENSNPMHMQLYARRSSSQTSEQYRVLYSTTTRDTAAFTNTLANVTISSSGWHLCDLLVPANARYLAIQYYSPTDRYYLLVDDITIRDTVITIHDTTYVAVHDTLLRIEYDTLYTTQQDTLYYTVTDTLDRWIVDTQIVTPTRYNLLVMSNASGRGKVSGSGLFPEGAEVEIAAMPRPRYRFTRWQDNNTDNPRRVTVTGNNAYTAYFEMDNGGTTSKDIIIHDTIYVHDTTWITRQDTIVITLHDTVWLPNEIHDTLWVDRDSTFCYDTTQYYTLTALSANEEEGVAAGNGSFPVGTEVSLGAISAPGYVFSHWSDNSIDLPYVVTLNSDITLTAYFTVQAGIDDDAVGTLWMVYALGENIVVQGAQGHRVSVYNVLGRQLYASPSVVRAEHLNIPAAAGVYLVRIDDQPAVKVSIR